MKRNRLIGAVLALGLLAGAGFGFKAMAQSGPVNTTTQNQNQFYRGGMMGGNFGGNFGGMMGGNFGGFMRGMRGFWNGNGAPQLTTEQQKEIITLRAELSNIMVDYQAKMTELRTKLDDAIKSGVKADILSAWEELKVLHTEIQAKIKPTTDKIAAIVGNDADYQNFMADRFEDSYLAQKMDELKSAATDADSQKIIDELKNGNGFGFRGPGMMNRRGGFGGGCRGGRGF